MYTKWNSHQSRTDPRPRSSQAQTTRGDSMHPRRTIIITFKVAPHFSSSALPWWNFQRGLFSALMGWWFINTLECRSEGMGFLEVCTRRRYLSVCGHLIVYLEQKSNECIFRKMADKNNTLGRLAYVHQSNKIKVFLKCSNRINSNISSKSMYLITMYCNPIE